MDAHRAVCRDEDPSCSSVGNSGPAPRRSLTRNWYVIVFVYHGVPWLGTDTARTRVWGGMSEDERRALKRRNARTKAQRSLNQIVPAQCGPTHCRAALLR